MPYRAGPGNCKPRKLGILTPRRSALEQAIRKYGVPDIFNTDQGPQFTCAAFTNHLTAVGALISMDGRGRALDNVFVERLWRSVKYEEVFLHDYATVQEAMEGLRKYFEFYNDRRLHQSLEYQTPKEVYEQSAPRILQAA